MGDCSILLVLPAVKPMGYSIYRYINIKEKAECKPWTIHNISSIHLLSICFMGSVQIQPMNGFLNTHALRNMHGSSW